MITEEDLRQRGWWNTEDDELVWNFGKNLMIQADDEYEELNLYICNGKDRIFIYEIEELIDLDDFMQVYWNLRKYCQKLNEKDGNKFVSFAYALLVNKDGEEIEE